MNTLIGKCYCKKVHFEIQPPTEFASHCHCESCRKSHGSAFVTWGGVSKKQFKFISGEHLIRRYNSSPQVRWCFCSECGTSLLYECDYEPEKIYFTVVNIQNELDRKPEAHFSFEEKVPWFHFHDGLPKYKEKTQQEISDFDFEEISQLLFQLEKKLHDPETRSNTKELKTLLDPGFFEFGSSGKTWKLEQTLNNLPAENKSIKIESSHFNATKLSYNSVLITYISTQYVDGKQQNECLRSSIWIKSDGGDWKMRFHQGTPKNN